MVGYEILEKTWGKNEERVLTVAFADTREDAFKVARFVIDVLRATQYCFKVPKKQWWLGSPLSQAQLVSLKRKVKVSTQLELLSGCAL